jgi:hypothetical protein
MKSTLNAAVAAGEVGTRRGLSLDEIKMRDIDRAIDAAVLADAGGGSGWVCMSSCLGFSGIRGHGKNNGPCSLERNTAGG